MKKILIFFADIFNTGGLQQYNRHLCDAIAKNFPQTEFIGLSLHDPGEASQGNSWPNIKIEFCGAGKIRIIQKIVFVIKAFVITITQKPDIFICCHADIAPLTFLLKKTFGTRYILLTHGTDVWRVRKGIKYRAITDADKILTVSKYTRDRMIANGIQEERIEYLHDTIDTSRFFPKPVNTGIISGLRLENKRLLLTVGRMRSDERYKGHDIMLRVMQMLGSEYVWLVIGDGHDLARLKRTAGKMEVAEKVRFLGKVGEDELVDYYNLCDCFIMPSKGEGFGIVFLEALACGKPVICGNKDGSLEPLMNGELGYAVDPDNAEEIAKSVNSVFLAKNKKTDPVYLRSTAEKKFGINAFYERTREIFSGILG